MASEEHDTSPDSGDRYRVYQADSRNLREKLKEEFSEEELEGLVDATVTSPPYADIKDYGYDEQIGKGDSYEQYLDDLRQVYKEVYEITAEDGSLWVNVNDRQKGGRVVDIPGDIVGRLENLEDHQYCPVCGHCLHRDRERGVLECRNYQAHGSVEEDDLGWAAVREDKDGTAVYYDPAEDSWVCDRKVIWNKQKSNDERDGMRNVAEYVLVFKKSDEFSINNEARIYDPTQLKQWWISDTYNYSPEGATYPNVWDIPAEITGGWGDDDLEHEAVFPPALVERMIEMATSAGDTVLDPFAGTGTTLAVGSLMERKTIGFELNQDFIALHESRAEAIQRFWERDDHLSPRERKQRYAQATWALRHHGYVKWLFTTLRSEARDVADTHALWTTLADAGLEDALTGSEEAGTTIGDVLDTVLASEQPVTTFLEVTEMQEKVLKDRLSINEGESSNVNSKAVTELLEEEQSALLKDAIEFVSPSPVDALGALLTKFASSENHSSESLSNAVAELEEPARSEILGHLDDNAHLEVARRLVGVFGEVGVYRWLAEVVSAGVVETVARDLDSGTQVTLGNFGREADSATDRADVLAGVFLLAILYTTDLVGEVADDSFEYIEPLAEIRRTYGDRFGIHAVVLQPETPDGTPADGTDTAPVKQTFLFETAEAADEVGEPLERAIAYLVAEQPTSNAKKLRKHKLDAEMEWLGSDSFSPDKQSYPPETFYLYSKGTHQRYQSSFDTGGRLWEMCTSRVGAWEERYCSRTTPAIISPLALIIEETTPDKPQYAITRVNDFGEASETESPSEYESYF